MVAWGSTESGLPLKRTRTHIIIRSRTRTCTFGLASEHFPVADAGKYLVYIGNRYKPGVDFEVWRFFASLSQIVMGPMIMVWWRLSVGEPSKFGERSVTDWGVGHKSAQWKHFIYALFCCCFNASSKEINTKHTTGEPSVSVRRGRGKWKYNTYIIHRYR